MRQLKKCDSSLRREIAKNQRPGTFLEPFGPEKVPGIVQYFFGCFLSAKAETLFEALPQAHHPLPRQEIVHQQCNDHTNGGVQNGERPAAEPCAGGYLVPQGVLLYPQGRRLLGALCGAGTGTPARIAKEAVAHRFSRKCNSLFLLWAISPPMQKILWSAGPLYRKAAAARAGSECSSGR